MPRARPSAASPRGHDTAFSSCWSRPALVSLLALGLVTSASAASSPARSQPRSPVVDWTHLVPRDAVHPLQNGTHALAPNFPVAPRQIAPSSTGALILGQPSIDPSSGGFLGFPIPSSSNAAADSTTPPAAGTSMSTPPASSAPDPSPTTLAVPSAPSLTVATPSSPAAASSSASSIASSTPSPAVAPASTSALASAAVTPSATSSSTLPSASATTAAGTGSPTTSTLPAPPGASSNSLSGSIIAGIVVGSVGGALLILAALLVFGLCCRRRRRHRHPRAVSPASLEKTSQDLDSQPIPRHQTPAVGNPKYGTAVNASEPPRFASIEQTPYSPTAKTEVARMLDRQSKYSEFSPVEPYSATSDTPMLQQSRAAPPALAAIHPPPLAPNPRPARHRHAPSDIPASVLGAGVASREKRVGTPVSPITPTHLDLPPSGTFLDSPTNSWPSLGTVSDQQHASMASDRSSGPWMGVSGPMSIDATTAAAADAFRRADAAETSSSIEPPAPPARDSHLHSDLVQHAQRSSDELRLEPPPKSHHRNLSNEHSQLDHQAVYPSSSAIQGFDFGLAQPSAPRPPAAAPALPPPPRSPLRTAPPTLPPIHTNPAPAPARSGYTTPTASASASGAESGYWTPAERTPHASRERLSRVPSHASARSTGPPTPGAAAAWAPSTPTPTTPVVPPEQALFAAGRPRALGAENTEFADGPSQQLAMVRHHRTESGERGLYRGGHGREVSHSRSRSRGLRGWTREGEGMGSELQEEETRGRRGGGTGAGVPGGMI